MNQYYPSVFLLQSEKFTLQENRYLAELLAGVGIQAVVKQWTKSKYQIEIPNKGDNFSKFFAFISQAIHYDFAKQYFVPRENWRGSASIISTSNQALPV